MKTALITGAFGQDGYFLTKRLLEIGDYKVICTGRNLKSNINVFPKNASVERVELDVGNILDLSNTLSKYNPDEFYHLAAFSAPMLSWDCPEDVLLTNGFSTLAIIEKIHLLGLNTRFFFASSAKIFDTTISFPQNENTSVNPMNPYSLGKYIGHQAVKMYRERYGMYACNGILYNHESYLKNDNFVVYKICKNAKLLKEGKIKSFSLYNLDSEIDFGDPRDYVNAMWMIMQQQTPDDYIISTNNSLSIKDICIKVGEMVGITDILSYIEIKDSNSQDKRNYLRGDNSKIKSIGWESVYNIDDTLRMILDNI